MYPPAREAPAILTQYARARQRPILRQGAHAREAVANKIEAGYRIKKQEIFSGPTRPRHGQTLLGTIWRNLALTH